MSYIGNPIISTDFPKDTFSGNGSATAFTMSIAPASVNAIIVIVSGVTQDTSTYSIVGTTLTFSAAPPSGTDNIAVRHLGVAGIPNVPSAGSVVTSSIADANVTPTKLSQSFTSGNAVASTSGTSITFTSIPSWAKRVTVMFNGVSTNGGSDILIRIGSGSIATSGYVSYAVYTGVGTAGGGSTAGFRTIATSGGQSWNGFSTIVLQNSSTNSYSSNGLNSDGSSYMAISSGSIALSGVMDRVQVITANGTDTFDAGSINILYE